MRNILILIFCFFCTQLFAQDKQNSEITCKYTKCDTVCGIEVLSISRPQPIYKGPENSFADYVIKEMKKDWYISSYFYQEKGACCDDIMLDFIVGTNGKIICTDCMNNGLLLQKVANILLTRQTEWQPSECEGILYNCRVRMRLKLYYGPFWKQE